MSVAVFGTHLRSSLPAGASRLRLGRRVMNVSHLSGAVGAFVSIMFASPGLQFAERLLWHSRVSTNYERDDRARQTNSGHSTARIRFDHLAPHPHRHPRRPFTP